MRLPEIYRGTINEAIRKVRKNLGNYKYLFRTDVKKYYASLDHEILFKMLREFIGEGTVLSLLYQFMKRTIYKEGEYYS